MAKHPDPEPTVNTVLFSEIVESAADVQYLHAQQQLLEVAQHHPGFINADLLAPMPRLRKEWLTIIQFDHEYNLEKFLNSQDFHQISLEKTYVQASKRQLMSNFSQKASMLITTTIRPENEQKWLKWNEKIHQTMQTFPGFLHSDIRPSKIEHKAHNKTWVVNFQFNSLDTLNQWLNSPERQALIAEGKPLYEHTFVSQFPSGFSSWFDRSGQSVKLASWKMPIIVEMSLYPMVLVQSQFTGLFPGVPLPVVLLINTLYGCFLMQYVLIPIIQKFMGFWLDPNQNNNFKINGLGLGLAGIYLLLICQVAMAILTKRY